MKLDREFVHNRNDEGIPDDRQIYLIENDGSPFTNYPYVSVIIPTIDGVRNGYFKMLLRQLKDQTFQNFEIVVVKGDSRQGRAINSGVDVSRGKYILTLDDDTSMQSIDAIQILVGVLEKDQSIGMAGGINVIPKRASHFIKKAMEEIPRRKTPHVESITDSDLAEHPLLMMRRLDFVSIGGENELIPRGLDPYLRNQYRLANLRVVVVPGARYSHLPPDRISRLIKQFYRNGVQAAFCNKFYPKWIYETPSNHGEEFQKQVSYITRIVRYPVRIFNSFIKFQWVWFLSQICYATGFVWGYISVKNTEL